MNTITFDIETVPVQRLDLIAEIEFGMKFDLDWALAAIRAPSNYKDEAKIAEYITRQHDLLVGEHVANVQDAILKTSFDGGMGQVCVIGFAFNDGPAFSYQVTDLSLDAEVKLLEDFYCWLTDVAGHNTRFVGHNVIGFDLPFLWKRSIVLGVKPPACLPRDPKPWDDAVFDTMLRWYGTGAKAGGSMEKVCRALGIAGKGGMDGSQVWPMVQAGRIAEVATYCEGDVNRTRAMYQRMTFASQSEPIAA